MLVRTVRRTAVWCLANNNPGFSLCGFKVGLVVNALLHGPSRGCLHINGVCTPTVTCHLPLMLPSTGFFSLNMKIFQSVDWRIPSMLSCFWMRPWRSCLMWVQSLNAAWRFCICLIICFLFRFPLFWLFGTLLQWQWVWQVGGPWFLGCDLLTPLVNRPVQRFPHSNIIGGCVWFTHHHPTGVELSKPSCWLRLWFSSIQIVSFYSSPTFNTWFLSYINTCRIRYVQIFGYSLSLLGLSLYRDYKRDPLSLYNRLITLRHELLETLICRRSVLGLYTSFAVAFGWRKFEEGSSDDTELGSMIDKSSVDASGGALVSETSSQKSHADDDWRLDVIAHRWLKVQLQTVGCHGILLSFWWW